MSEGAAPLPQHLVGTWVKDRSASDSPEEAMSLMRINGLLRTAIRRIKGCRISQSQQQLVHSIFSVISVFKVVEHYSLSGDAVSYNMRRDFRRGRCRGAVRPTPAGTLLLSYEWDEPLAGSGVDEFSVSPDGQQLRVRTTLHVGERSVSCTQAYRRKA